MPATVAGTHAPSLGALRSFVAGELGQLVQRVPNGRPPAVQRVQRLGDLALAPGQFDCGLEDLRDCSRWKWCHCSRPLITLDGLWTEHHDSIARSNTRSQALRSGTGLTARPILGPMELDFSGEIWFWKGPAPFHFVTVPDEDCAAIEAVSSQVTYGWGVIPVTARIGATTWTTSLFPKAGLYLVPIKVAVRKAERLDLGDVVSIRLTIDV